MINSTTTDKLIADKLAQSMSYKNWLELMYQLERENKTTGPKQTESMISYTRLNAHRMNRLEKTVKLTEEMKEKLGNLQRSYIWLVITESWCGDAAQLLPVIAAMANSTDMVALRLILRDEHSELMERFLTDGSRSIPKLIAIDTRTGKVVGSWGPRPQDAQAMVIAHKADPQESYQELQKRLQMWYNKDKGLQTQEEMAACIDYWEGLDI